MAKTPDTGQPRPLTTTSDAGDDPDAGQATGPHGEAPVDPAAKAMYRGCLTILLGIAIALVVSMLLYRVLVAT